MTTNRDGSRCSTSRFATIFDISAHPRASTLIALKVALETAGVEFVADGAGLMSAGLRKGGVLTASSRSLE
jgi:hypothetical protein